jgi:tRNA G26 N,N-dimethylase Trm1
MKIISEELSIPYHYDIHEIASYLKAKEIPKIEEILSSIKASRTHFNPTGIKTEEYNEFLEFFT